MLSQAIFASQLVTFCSVSTCHEAIVCFFIFIVRLSISTCAAVLRRHTLRDADISMWWHASRWRACSAAGSGSCTGVLTVSQASLRGAHPCTAYICTSTGNASGDRTSACSGEACSRACAGNAPGDSAGACSGSASGQSGTGNATGEWLPAHVEGNTSQSHRYFSLSSGADPVASHAQKRSLLVMRMLWLYVSVPNRFCELMSQCAPAYYSSFS